MTEVEAVVLLVGGILAGIINSMAGGGSLLSVPLLSLAGVGGTVANGTNRIAVLVQNITGAYGYARRDVGDRRRTIQVLVPAMVGGLVGSLAASQIPDEAFERIFGLLMLPLLYLSIRTPKVDPDREPWPLWLSSVVFVGVGFYAGAVQAGVGLIILLVLSRAGFDLVTANAMKTVVILGVTALAVPVFIVNDQVRWIPALVLSVGMGVGGYLGANIAVDGGERVIRPVLIVVVLVLASRMLGLWDVLGIA
ncbi:MAG: sulfite exporter TauE/SafE family protein [Actinomycetota bacterium]